MDSSRESSLELVRLLEGINEPVENGLILKILSCPYCPRGIIFLLSKNLSRDIILENMNDWNGQLLHQYCCSVGRLTMPIVTIIAMNL